MSHIRVVTSIGRDLAKRVMSIPVYTMTCTINYTRVYTRVYTGIYTGS